MALERWLDLIGRDDITGYRWREAGIIKCENVLGRQFIADDEIARFWQRAKAGEFHLEPRGAAAKAKDEKAKDKRNKAKRQNPA